MNTTSKKILTMLVPVVFLVCAFLVLWIKIYSNHYIVTNTDDSGPGSLRQTICEASSGGTITFADSLSGQTIVLTNGQLMVDKNLVIDASALSQGIAIDGNRSTRVFEFASQTTNAMTGLILTNGLTQSGTWPDNSGGAILLNSGAILTIRHCTLISNSAAYNGGSIESYGTLTINNSIIKGNTANFGGGVRSQNGRLTLNNVILNDNSATNQGGGILSIFNPLTLDAVTLRGNSAKYGGGIYNYGREATINNTTLSGNSAISDGGGIRHEYGMLSVDNSTLSDNSATIGGGIYSDHATNEVSRVTLNGNLSTDDGGGGIYFSCGVMVLDNSTLSGNEAKTGGGIYNSSGSLLLNNSTLSGNLASTGGGIYNCADYALRLFNTIVAANDASRNPNIRGNINSGTNNIVSGDPLLAPLGNYGGPTQTLPPLPDSPAIDAGGTSVLATDQRGLARLAGNTVDIGAVEYQGASDRALGSNTGPSENYQVPPDTDAYQSALMLIKKGKQGEAEELLSRAVKSDVTNQRLVFFMGVCARSRWLKQNALPIFSYVSELNPDTPEGKCSALMLEIDTQDEYEANFATLEALQKSNPDDPLILWMTAVACRELGRRGAPLVYSQKGAMYYAKLLEIFDPGPVLLHQTYANILSEELGLHHEALKHREIALHLEPASWSHQGMANTLTYLERYAEADKHYEQSIALAPDRPEYLASWAWSMQMRKNYEKASELYQKAAEVATDLNWQDDAKRYHNKAVALERSIKR